MQPIREVRRTVAGDTAQGEGESFRPRPRWPTVAQLEYVQKFATAALLTLGLLILLAYAVHRPGHAAAAIADAARKRAGV
jgi:hypothetical protein